MKTFKDKAGVEWSIDLNLGILYQIESAVDFSEITQERLSFRKLDERTLSEILTNPFIAPVIAWFCVREDAIKRNVNSDVAFYSRLDNETIKTLQRAIVEELAKFFPFLQTSIPKLIAQFSRIQEVAKEEIDRNEDINLSKEQIRTMIQKEFTKRKADLLGETFLDGAR